MKKVAILGVGSWGTAQALVLSRNVPRVFLWGRPADGVEKINAARENQIFLPGIHIPENVEVTPDLEMALAGAEMVVLAVPAQAIREVLDTIKLRLPAGSILVNTAKGLEIETGMRMSQVVEDLLGPQARECYAVLSGPSHAEEVGKRIPTAVTVAAFKKQTAFAVQDVYMSPVFRVYTHPDVAGVELGGALKNIVALATGMTSGLGYGDNTRAALLTRGLAEMIRIGVALGGDARTFSGLSGIGDLVVTCGSPHSRNHRAGEMLGRGLGLAETLQEVGMVVEGVHTTRAVYQLSRQMNVDMPICAAVHRILYEEAGVRDEVDYLMKRRKKHEIEEGAKNITGW